MAPIMLIWSPETSKSGWGLKKFENTEEREESVFDFIIFNSLKNGFENT
jgi:hypothetical protein